MPTLHDLMSASINMSSHRLADAVPSDSTRALIGRRRRRNAAVAGGSSALAIGGLLAAALTQTRRVDGNDPATPAPPSADPTAVEYVTTSVEDAAAPLRNQAAGGAWCDQQIPEPQASSNGFTQNVTLTQNTLSSHDGRAIISSLTYDGPDTKPAFVMPAAVVIVRDGVVVGLGTDSSVATSYAPLTTGEQWNTKPVPDDIFGGPASPCHSPSHPTSTDVLWAAGEYQLYVVSEAYTSKVAVAVNELTHQGYRIALDSEGAWAPGSIDCQRESTPSVDWPSPVQCLDAPPAGVTIVAATGKVTLPYHDANYGGDLDVTLVSQPITVSLDHDILFGPVSYPSDTAPNLACGAGHDSLSGSAASDTQFVVTPSLADLAAGVALPLQVDLRGGGADKQRGTLHMGEGATAWVVYGDTTSNYWVGASATPVFTPNDIPIDRLHGYPEVSLTLENYAGCPPATEGTWAQRTLDPTSTSSTLVIQGDFTIDWEDGATEERHVTTLFLSSVP